MTQSPSQTVSIYEALAEILSKPTESLTLYNNKSTESTLVSEAPISSTTTSPTTTTTTSTSTIPSTSTAVYEESSKVQTSQTTEMNSSVNKTLILNIPSSQPNNMTSPKQNDTRLTSDIDTNETVEFTKTETNGSVDGTNKTDNDQAAYPSTNIPKYTLPNSTLVPASSDIETKTTIPRLDLMTRKVVRKNGKELDIKTTSLFPIYKPVFRSEGSTEPMKPFTTSSILAELLTTQVPLVTTFTPNYNLTTLVSRNASPFSRATSTETIFISTISTESLNANKVTTSVPKVKIPLINRTRNMTKTESPFSTDPPSRPPVTSTPKPQNPLNISLSEIIQFNKQLVAPIKSNERVVYAVLANNTVVRKIIKEPKIVADQHIVYGILPNGTLVRKFRNGTVIRDDTSIEITNVDPKSLINAKNDAYKPPINSMRWLKSTTTKNYLPKTTTEQTKTVFYLSQKFFKGSSPLCPLSYITHILPSR